MNLLDNFNFFSYNCNNNITESPTFLNKTMNKYFSLSALFIVLSLLSVPGQSPQIINIENRNLFSLNGRWKYIIDPYENGYYDNKYKPFDTYEKVPAKAFFMDSRPKDKSDLIEYSFDNTGTLKVPGDWNSQEEKLFFYEGTIWYRRLFDNTLADSSNRLFVYFGAANYESEVYLNQQKLGTHTGGFTPFNFEITDLVKAKNNSLIVKVDNKRKAEGVPTLNTDWWNYGGITRDVYIVEVPSTFIREYALQLNKGSASEITGYVILDGAENETEVTVSIPELNIDQTVRTDETGYGEFTIKPRGIKLWSPENPFLYEVNIKTGRDKVSDLIGFRTIETKGDKILLNGNQIFLRGISIHEENPVRSGRAYSIEDARMLLNWAKELNCNYVRLAHYPHNENMVRLADEMGIMVWEENPVYWTIQWENQETLKNATNQLGEVITRDKNRASVIIWSMANETPVLPSRLNFIRSLIDYTRSRDDSRLISAALEKHTKSGSTNIQVVEDPLAEYIDILGINEYIGWYGGTPLDIAATEWEINYTKPLIISEFGGGALQGFHGDKGTRWTEEFQEELYRETIIMLDKIPQYSGVTPWILTDFRSPRRMLPGIQDGWNRKGLISETGDKKKAFGVLKLYYDSKEEEYKFKKGLK